MLVQKRWHTFAPTEVIQPNELANQLPLLLDDYIDDNDIPLYKQVESLNGNTREAA